MSRTTVSEHHLATGSYNAYIAGFLLSIICTLTAYILVEKFTLSKWLLVYVVAALAVTQAIIQLILFLHLGNESGPRLKLLVFSFMMLIVAILISGSIWIMYNLNYRMTMTPTQINQYMQSQEENAI